MEQKFVPTDLARWLRRRRKLRAARAGSPVGPDDSDFYNPDGTQAGGADDFPIAGCLSVIAVLVAVFVIGFFLIRSIGGGGEEIIGSPPVSVAPSSTVSSSGPAASISSSTATTQPAISDATLRGLLTLLGISVTDTDAVDELKDLIGDIIDSVKLLTAGYQGREIDIDRAIALLARLGQRIVDVGFNLSVYECGDDDPVVVCGFDPSDIPAGDVLIVAVEMAAAIPPASTEVSYRYSIVFDTDGDAANDWQFVDPFEWDYFQGSDRWYQAVYDHLSGTWFLEVTQLQADGSFPAEGSRTAARFVIDGPWGVWFIPVDELGGSAAPFRVTAFAHDGAFTEATRGGDVMGPDPTGPLTDPPTVPAFVDAG